MLVSMADGETHDKHGLLLLVTLLPLSLLAIALKQAGVLDTTGFVLGAVLGAFWLSPDLDMWNTKPTNRWGPLKILWAPYAWVHNHRGISHSWLIGPATRILYVGAPVLLIWSFWGFEGIGPWLAWGCAGVYLANWVHLVGDRHWPWK